MTWTSDVQKRLGLYNRDITPDEFAFALPLDKHFVLFLFHHLDVEGKGVIPLACILARLREFDSLSPIDKLHYIFRVNDAEGSGLLDMTLLKVALEAWCHSLGVSVDTDKLDAIAGALFEGCTAGIDDVVVSVSEVMVGIQQNPKLLEAFTRSADKSNSRRVDLERVNKKQPVRTFRLPTRYLKRDYLWYNRRKVISFLLFVAINIAMFSYGSYRYRESNWFVIIARGCGFALNFNCALILILVLRTLLTYLHTTRLAKYLPLNQHILFHQIVGITIGVYGVIHTVCHIANVLIICQNDQVSVIFKYLFTWHSGVGYFYGSAYLTGWLLFVILLMMICASLRCVRHRHFKIFYGIHLLAIPFIILCLLHGPRFWKLMVLPGLLFIAEKVWSSKFCKMIRFGDTYIKEAHLLPNGVVHIVLMRPKRFKFQPGDYIFVQMPTLSNFEWHPFTISSPPEEEDISCHIRSLGDWTKRLYDFFNSNPSEPTQEYRLKEDGERQGKVRFTGENKRLYDFFDNKEKYTYKVEERNGNPVVDHPLMDHPLIDHPLAKKKPPQNSALPTGISILIEQERNQKAWESAEESDTTLTTRHPLLAEGSNTASRRKTLSQMSLQKLRRSISLKSRRAAMTQMTSTQTSFEVRDNEVRVVSKLTEDVESLRVYIDGPYGTPTRRVFEADHAVLIATGIGITPFASVVQSVMHRYRRCKATCPKCKCSWPVDETLKTVLKLKKVDLIWINREQRSFEWFVSLLSELEVEIGEDDEHYRNFVKIHLYMTSDPGQSTLQDIALQAALDQMCKRNTKDVITGLRTRTKLGRPNWDQVFAQIRDEKMGKVKVFFCGPGKLASILKTKCQKYRFTFSKEVF